MSNKQTEDFEVLLDFEDSEVTEENLLKIYEFLLNYKKDLTK